MRRMTALVALLAALWLPGLAQAASCKVPGDVAAAGAVILKNVNAARAKAGLRPLKMTSSLVKASQGHACYMARSGNFSHNGAGGISHATRAKRAGCRWKSALAENIAYGYKDPVKIYQMWMGSPHHRANILNRKVRLAGVAYAEGGPHGPYWVMMYAGGC
ncbi:CAP domain-containing protein [Frigidibacter sp. ROC022]|uniref:CAP domain-containing protein n=1 Tax=Frigidibacter sp. ROC022 TaxID=2971796 RepID=UPI00215AACF3|nr:CAP domain-containing protein [Frigidibacter sp. ROC022]MCR8722873.1 CAP domain-containing protein [Frigidibacter sp. ROC022]